ncbi:MAG: hypothetical protein IJT15_01275 [Rickettsiales bacterium]|nr:hypothetical protein [Rickettsiales bacterium]
MQEEQSKIKSETIQGLLLEGQDKFTTLLRQKSTDVQKSLDDFFNVANRIQYIKDNATLENIDGYNNDIIALEMEFNKYKQEFNNLCHQNDKTKNNEKKPFDQINAEINEWRKILADKIKTELDDIWDEANQKFKKETRWFFNPFSSKPTQNELEQQKNMLIAQSSVVQFFGQDEIINIMTCCSDINRKESQIEALLTSLKQLSKMSTEKKHEEAKRSAEEKNVASLKLNQGKKTAQQHIQKNTVSIIEQQEINKIANWLQTEQNATYITKEDIIEQCHDFGVDNYDDFKIAFLQEIELEKMQNFIKNDRNIMLSKEECKELFKHYGIKTFSEFREQLNQGMQKIAETIGGDGINEVCNKLYNEAQNISDYVDCMNSLSDNQDKPLIKKVDVNLLQAKADRLKKTLGEKNIFIQFLMLFGYDPDGLVTAYHIAKDRLKEAKWDERNNLLNNSGNNFINNNSEYSKMYSGNKNVVNNNNVALFGRQSIRPLNNNLGY